MDGLKMKHDEEISAPIKIVILVGMLLKDYQDMCFQQATGVSAESEVKYIELRDKIMNIANRRMSMITPTPMDIDAVNQQGGDDWYGDIWPNAISNYGPPGKSWEEPPSESVSTIRY